jgi:hypothetical protein
MDTAFAGKGVRGDRHAHDGKHKPAPVGLAMTFMRVGRGKDQDCGKGDGFT